MSNSVYTGLYFRPANIAMPTLLVAQTTTYKCHMSKKKKSSVPVILDNANESIESCTF